MISTVQWERCGSIESEDIVKLAQLCLKQSDYALLQQVSVECERGVLFLRGSLPSYHHKQLAQEVVRRVDGVTQVINQIEVSRPHPR
jgi:osmotically-inducible protein OsmY